MSTDSAGVPGVLDHSIALQVVLVEEELAQFAVSVLHLVQCGDLAGQIALASQLLLQVHTSQVVHQMVVVVTAIASSTLTGLDQIANGLGHFGFQLEGILQGRQTSPFVCLYSL